MLSGALKVISPESAEDVLRALRVPAPSVAVRLLGVGEMALGVAGVLIAGRAVAAVVAAAYLLFAAISELLRRSAGDDLASCGCFGSSTTPPSIIHTSVNIFASLVGFAAVIWPAQDLLSELGEQPAAGSAFVALVVLATALLFLAFTALPRALAPPSPNPDIATFEVRRL